MTSSSPNSKKKKLNHHQGTLKNTILSMNKKLHQAMAFLFSLLPCTHQIFVSQECDSPKRGHLKTAVCLLN
jgi:hypothetical protein